MLAEYALGLHTTHVGIGHYTSAGIEIILLVALWRLMHQLRKEPARSVLGIGEALLQGILASLVAAMVFYVFVFAYLNFINPDYPDLLLDWKVAQERAAGTSEEEIRVMARSFRWGVSPRGLPVMVFGRCLLLALIASPLLALWVNRRRSPSTPAN